MLTEEQVKLKGLVAEAVAVLCKNTLSFSAGVTIEGLLGITTDNSDVFLINLNENLTVADGSSDASRAVHTSKPTSVEATKRPGQGARKRARENSASNSPRSNQAAADANETESPPSKRPATTAERETQNEATSDRDTTDQSKDQPSSAKGPNEKVSQLLSSF